MQACYGKCFYLTITGYLITQSSIIGIVHIDEEMTYLEFKNQDSEENLCEQFSSIELNDNICQYKTVVPFSHEDVAAQENNVQLEDWSKDEVLDLKNYRLIHLAQRKIDLEQFDIRKVKKIFFKKLNSLNEIHFTEFDSISVSRLPENEWLVKLPQKIKVKALFTGLYI